MPIASVRKDGAEIDVYADDDPDDLVPTGALRVSQSVGLEVARLYDQIGNLDMMSDHGTTLVMSGIGPVMRCR